MDDAVKGSVFLSQHAAPTFTKANFIISAMSDMAHIQVNKVQANFLALLVLTWNIKWHYFTNNKAIEVKNISGQDFLLSFPWKIKALAKSDVKYWKRSARVIYSYIFKTLSDACTYKGFWAYFPLWGLCQLHFVSYFSRHHNITAMLSALQWKLPYM